MLCHISSSDYKSVSRHVVGCHGEEDRSARATVAPEGEAENWGSESGFRTAIHKPHSLPFHEVEPTVVRVLGMMLRHLSRWSVATCRGVAKSGSAPLRHLLHPLIGRWSGGAVEQTVTVRHLLR